MLRTGGKEVKERKNFSKKTYWLLSNYPAQFAKVEKMNELGLFLCPGLKQDIVVTCKFGKIVGKEEAHDPRKPDEETLTMKS